MRLLNPPARRTWAVLTPDEKVAPKHSPADDCSCVRMGSGSGNAGDQVAPSRDDLDRGGVGGAGLECDGRMPSGLRQWSR